MGTYIFLTLVAAEIIFTAFCILTRSDQQRVRSILRLAGFAFFVLLCTISLIEWTLRYYSLAALLLLLAILGVTTLKGKKVHKRPYTATYMVLRAIGMIVLFFICSLPSILFPQHGALEPTGEFQTTSACYSYTDTNRIETYSDKAAYRKLNVELWFPQHAEGPFPLILFSHGAFGVKTSNLSLFRELASHGYVVCSIDHTYQCLYTTADDGHTTLMDMGYMREVSLEDAYGDRENSYKLYQEWMDIRTADISFVLDHILAEVKDNQADGVYKLVDTQRIGVMGHSLGGSAALGIGRMREDVRAVIALEAPFLCDITGVEGGEFVFIKAPYPVPLLSVYSDQGWGILATAPQYAENQELLVSANPAVSTVHIAGVGHLSLTDLALESPLLTRMLNGRKSTTSSVSCLMTINRACLAFLDSYVKPYHKSTENRR
ncbi:acetylxylan esterase [Sphaerochaeta sp. PS]|uniref:alpha/beta hydrolase family protein n=1 Tax=Sphaerochaeta sp. PS TaxID=3076336 RepID=UPI0028A4CCA4|nr:acetylxylan esterase [Sphaerochaeta sp. PS]MDT4763205.1 acetylxylan esterase [Sphaerochaeta sp. PS]